MSKTFSLVASAFILEDFAQTNVFARVSTAFAHLMIGCAI